MRNRAAIAALLSLLMLVATLPASAGPGVTIDPVKTAAKTEFLPAPGNSVTHGYFAWSSPVNGRSHVFVEVDGGPRSQIDNGVYGFAGAFAAGEDNLIFQQIKFPGGDAQSDLRMWDGLTGDTNAFVSNINTDQWQWAPSYDLNGSDLWLLYGENRFNGPKAPWKIILFDGSTAKKHVLAETTYRCGCIFPGTFAYPWVSWSKGLDGAVWRMNVETDVKEKLTVPGNRDEHSIGVTDDGTAYVVQDGAACGTHSKIFRIDPDGTATLIASLPAGTEAYTLAPFDTGTGIDVYFDRYKCSTKRYDIYVIRDAEAVTRTAPVHLGSGSGAPAGGRRMPVGAVPPH